jgi:hypothetical protein
MKKEITTKNGNRIVIEMVRKIQDKIAFCDGLNEKTGREIIEYTEINIYDNNNNLIARGNKVRTNIPEEMIESGAVGAVGEGATGTYISQQTAEIIKSALAELDTENPKSDDYIAIKESQARAEAQSRAFHNSQEQVAYRNFMRELEDPNSNY